jgi:GDPmannose 4,6-dehydratase
MAFKAAGVEVRWRGVGEAETGHCSDSGKLLVRVSPRFYRPAEVELLIGDASKAHRELGWEPQTMLEPLCKMMVDADMRRNEIGVSF